jgi:hypothetical protein
VKISFSSKFGFILDTSLILYKVVGNSKVKTLWLSKKHSLMFIALGQMFIDGEKLVLRLDFLNYDLIEKQTNR